MAISPDTALVVAIATARDEVEVAARLLRRRTRRLERLIDAAYVVAGDLPAADPMTEDRLAANARLEHHRIDSWPEERGR